MSYCSFGTSSEGFTASPPKGAKQLVTGWLGRAKMKKVLTLFLTALIVQTWIGATGTSAGWDLTETWTGAIEAPAEWQLIEAWTGVVDAPAEWKLIEFWTGTVETLAMWQLIEIWTGTIEGPVAWQLIETWTGTVSAQAEWQLVETWTGITEAPATWQLIESWTGTVEAPAAWQLIETWTGTVSTPATWQLVETWTGTVEAPVAWQLVETWTGTIEASAAWQLIETWTGTVSAPAAWQLVETWTGTIEGPVAWQLIETWISDVEATAEWQLIETWIGAVKAPAEWHLVETWTDTIEAPAEWQLVETWAGTVEAFVEWQLIETWTVAIEAPATWQLIETWTGTIEAPAAWQLIETWTGTVVAPAAWQLIETWTWATQAPAEWQLIETWTGMIGATAAWQLIETWAGTVNAPVARAVDVSVSPSWQENIAGGSLSYEIVVTNLGETTDDLNLSVSDTLGWGLSLDDTSFVDVENGGSRSTTLRVTIPGAAIPCQTDNITVTVTSGGSPSKSDSENCQAHVALLRDVEVEISPSWQEGAPGETLLYVVRVKNTGYLNDKYNLTANDNLGWTLEISPTELWIENGDNDIASLSVTIPLETVSSITDVITVRAEGTLAQGTSADPENVSAENTAEARCTVVRDVDVLISPSYQSGLPGTLLTYTVTITNAGNALDTYELNTSDNSGWSPVVTPSSVSPSPGASSNVTLKVIVPLGATRCTRDNLIVTATSQIDNTVSSSASCIAHAVTIIPHGPIHIIGNDNFTEANGVISGSGTSEDPYIIGYWDINAENVHGIWIESTDAYFIIRNCRTHDGGYGYNYGVYFNNVQNGKIESATSYFNDVGIYLKNSSNNIISKSNASYNVNGIYLQFSSNNIIEKCTASNNFSRGIHLASSDNNIISNCTAKSNTDGIYLQSSSNNKITDNSNTSNNGLCGIVIRFSSENNTVSQSIAENNYYGIYLSDLSDNNYIYHNRFRNRPYQAWDNCSNRWDNGYPSGGNYWSDYPGVDNYRGENQDIPGSDGIGDTPYYILGGANEDRYPLVIRSFQLLISPFYEEGMPGATLSYTVTVTNTSNIADNYSLTISDNAGWGPILTPSSLSVYPGNSENAILEVTIPENAENSNRDNIRVVARSQTDNTLSTQSNCIAHAVIRGVIVSISPSYQSASPGAELIYTVTVTNIGLANGTYNLSATDNSGWGPSVSPTSLSVLVGENRIAMLSVTVPESTMPNTEDNITVIAISQENPNVGDNDSCVASTSIGRGVEVLISPRENGELARENVAFTVKITNTGNAVDNYDLTVSDNLGWSPTLSENWLENVQPSENISVALTVTIPENAEPYTEDNITVIAISRGDLGVSDNDSCIVRVLSPKAEFSLLTLYTVNLDLDLWLDDGSKLVVKFYTYGNTFENENVIETFSPPWHVEENENARHPNNIGVKKARLDLTYDNTENVIVTISTFTVRRSNLIARISTIKGRWPFAPPAEKSALISEISGIKGQWPFAPA